jgi:hypothetical protein
LDARTQALSSLGSALSDHIEISLAASLQAGDAAIFALDQLKARWRQESRRLAQWQAGLSSNAPQIPMPHFDYTG